jgi:hypothetical protein
MEPLVAAALSEGKKSIEELMGNAARLQATISDIFKPTTLEAIAAEFAKTPDVKVINPQVAKTERATGSSAH